MNRAKLKPVKFLKSSRKLISNLQINLFPRQVGSGEERDFEDLLAHLAERIKLRFDRVCYREGVRWSILAIILLGVQYGILI